MKDRKGKALKVKRLTAQIVRDLKRLRGPSGSDIWDQASAAIERRLHRAKI